MLHLSARLRREIERCASAAHPAEACGLMIGRRYPGGVEVCELAAADNVSSEPLSSYEVDPRSFIAADDRARAAGLDIVGLWHSHPEAPARPSERDRAEACEGWSYVIVSVGAAGVRAWSCWTKTAVDMVGERFSCEATPPRSPAES